MNDNYRAAAAGRGLGRDELATLARNSFLGSFLAEEEKAAHLAQAGRLSRGGLVSAGGSVERRRR